MPAGKIIDNFLEKEYCEINIAAEVLSKRGHGGPNFRGVFHKKDRELPFPSPSANLVGVWKGNGQE